ncbi:putative Response regulator receiver protein [uncultured Eubacteriales bacterium]|uniref:Putative Response regulator receiver protein n=1 Tax=uncultured Eubacteriales bacterium TaxID=172733 RepID=A0A212JE39_9FIRM|nr:putative Response regulator receiver protein [uncultured Eubacteriales bacterium]
MSNFRLVILADTAQQRTALSAAAQGDIEVVESLSPTADTLARLAALSPDAVVLWYDGSERELALCERIYVSKACLSLVLVADEPDAALLSRALSCGVSRVLSPAEAEGELAKVVSHVVSRERSRLAGVEDTGARASRVISVFGTKGGTGKTMLSVNLAVALARLGQRVALVDLDLQFGDVGILLDIAKSDSIADVAEESAFDYSALKSYLFTHRSGLMGLCAPPSPEYAEVVTPEHVKKTVRSLRPNFDFVLLDMPPSFHDNSIAGLEESGEIYFLLNPDISTLHNARVSLGVLDSLGLSDRVKLVLNKNGGSSIKSNDIGRILERPLELIIPNDQVCALRAVNSGVPLVLDSRRNQMGKIITAYASKLLAGENIAKKGRR